MSADGTFDTSATNKLKPAAVADASAEVAAAAAAPTFADDAEQKKDEEDDKTPPRKFLIFLFPSFFFLLNLVLVRFLVDVQRLEMVGVRIAIRGPNSFQKSP